MTMAINYSGFLDLDVRQYQWPRRQMVYIIFRVTFDPSGCMQWIPLIRVKVKQWNHGSRQQVKEAAQRIFPNYQLKIFMTQKNRFRIGLIKTYALHLEAAQHFFSRGK